MASNTRVEWALRYENGSTQEVTVTHDDSLGDDESVLQHLARARGATLICRTITTTDWVAPARISAEAQAWVETAGVPADRKFILALRALRRETGWTLLEAVTALNAYLVSVGLSRTGVPDGE